MPPLLFSLESERGLEESENKTIKYKHMPSLISSGTREYQLDENWIVKSHRDRIWSRANLLNNQLVDNLKSFASSSTGIRKLKSGFRLTSRQHKWLHYGHVSHKQFQSVHAYTEIAWRHTSAIIEVVAFLNWILTFRVLRGIRRLRRTRLTMMQIIMRRNHIQHDWVALVLLLLMIHLVTSLGMH